MTVTDAEVTAAIDAYCGTPGEPKTKMRAAIEAVDAHRRAPAMTWSFDYCLPGSVISEIAYTQSQGYQKHGGAFNWRNRRTSAKAWIAGMRRHLDAFERGEDIDHDSGRHPLTHLASRCIIVLDAIEYGVLNDDRELEASPANPPCKPHGDE